MTRSEYLPFGKPNFSDEEIAAVTRVLRSGWVGMGPETESFERELAEFLGAPHVVTVSSCTAAMFLSLLAHGVGAGDEVICPSLTWCSTASVALHLGARPVFCDVDPNTFCVTPEMIRQKLTPKTKAVMVVHLAGLAVDVAALRAALPPYVAIIEDAAHALGAKYAGGKPVGAAGNLTCFSFYANKNLSTGEGGAIALRDENIANRLRSLRQHGLSVDAWKRFTHPNALLVAPLEEIGYKLNYTDLQASIGRVQLRRQPEFHARRLAQAAHYCETLGAKLQVGFQADCLSPAHARHLFLLRLPVERMRLTRDEVILALRARNIGASIHYAPLHQMKVFGADNGALPNTEKICREIVTLPIGAAMTIDDAAYVAAQVLDVLQDQCAGAAQVNGAKSANAAAKTPAVARADASVYGFHERLSAAFPSQVIVDTTEICNLACVHCPHPQFKQTELYAGRCLDPELCQKAVDEVRTHGKGIAQYIRFTGEGEPFAHPKILEMLGYAVKHSGTTVSLTTNGSLLNDKRIDGILAAGVHVVDISIDAFTPETYAKVRVNGDLAVTQRNVLRLICASQLAGSKTKIVVSFVEQPDNTKEAAPFKKYWEEHGADYVVVRRLHSNAGASGAIAERLKTNDEARRPCLYPWERISLTPRGELIFCPQDWVRGSAVADYRQTTIRETWQSDFYRKLREAHLCNEFSQHSFCGNCPDWRQTRWPGQGRSYADMMVEFKERE